MRHHLPDLRQMVGVANNPPMLTAIVIVAIFAVLLAAFGGFALGVTVAYRLSLGLPPVKMPTFRQPQTEVESGDEEEEPAFKYPEVRT